jgi:uncharacterized protein
VPSARHTQRIVIWLGAEGTTKPDSDVDLLVEFEAGVKSSLFDIAQIALELSSLPGGRRVELCTAAELSGYFGGGRVHGEDAMCLRMM